MYKGRSISAVIAAGGIGSRMGGSIPKQYMKINGISAIRRCADVFAGMGVFDRIIAACSAEFMDVCRNELRGIEVTYTEGGRSRQETILKALSHVDTDIVLVHDAARPFVTERVIKDVIEGAISYGGCICGVRPKDTIRNDEMTFDRSTLTSVQTPQGFDAGMLKKAYIMASEAGFEGTDDAGVFEFAGGSVHITEGDYANIKITTREDMPVETRIGTGYDVHRLVEGRPCILGGAVIPYERGLMGHSDADVLVHAVMDALLGAASLGDIGKLFPDTDERYRGASSIVLLAEVGRKIHDEGFKIGNIDAVVIAQKPKISPYTDEMRHNISRALGISEGKVSVKGTTTEKLGFEGRGEGIACQAVCILNT